MARDPKRLEYVNLHLLKASIKQPTAAIAPDKRPQSLSANAEVLRDSVLFFQAPPANAVGWRDFLQPAFGAAVDRFRSQHTSAALVFPTSGRLFVATFGYGRALLADSALEPDFGLRTALNLCDPATLRAVDYRTIEERTRIGRMQLSEEGSVNAFRMDMDTDLLRGLEARSRDKSVCERLGAKWASLTVGARIKLNDLPALAAKLLKFYGKKHLPADFAWINNVRRILDVVVLAQLDAELEKRLDNKQHQGIRLALPEITGGVMGSDAKLFKPDGIDFDSDITTYMNNRPRVGPSTIHSMRDNHRVVLVDLTSGKERESMPIYRCLVVEMDVGGRRYLLADGEWFELDLAFVQEIDAAVGKIKLLNHRFPTWKNGEAEPAWNTRAGKHWKDAALLDRANLSYGGSNSRVEPADFLTKAHVFAHVKRRDKNSSGLSHLFAQGAVAAEIISRDRSFRKQIAAILPRSHSSLATTLKAATFDPRQWTIGYVVLGADTSQPAAGLPFFSKVNLRKHSAWLSAMQFRVGIIGV